MPSTEGSGLVVHTVQKRTMSDDVDQVPPAPAVQFVGTSAPESTGLAPAAARMVTLLLTITSPSR